MARMKSQSLKTAPKRQYPQIEAKLEKKLLAYAAVASAAGVAALAAPQAAEAKVVYTAVNTLITSPYPLDLNGDGLVDFYLLNGGAASIAGSWRVSYLDVCHIAAKCLSSSSMLQANASNRVRAAASGAAVLPFGAKIGPGEEWNAKGQGANLGFRFFYSGSNYAQRWGGPWANGGQGETNKYLGIKFKIGNQFHYGWARVTFKVLARSYQATITGYAYETIPGKAIRAGDTTGTAETAQVQAPRDTRKAASQEASLGLLSAGAPGLPVWRRDDFVS